MLKQKFEVQRCGNQVHVARQSGDAPHPQPGEALLRMAACGICAADIRIVTKNKEASATPGNFITLGHEGVGRIIALNSSCPELQPGDYAVILPHTHKDQSTSGCLSSRVNPVCIGSGHTLHMGWDIDGCFANFIRAPVPNLVRVAPPPP
jgi:threonine dehydrogenase-like Zn-dependent dehydrogenase